MVVNSTNADFSCFWSAYYFCAGFSHGGFCIYVVLSHSMQLSFLHKKIILILIVVVELAVGVFFLVDYFQEKIAYKLTSPDKAMAIDKSTLVFDDPDFRYYYKLQANTVITEQPDWLQSEVRYTYNNDGLNDRFNYVVEKPANTFRIIALGDSFTYGALVPTEENWTEKLEVLLQDESGNCGFTNFEVLNLGMPGFDVPYIVKRYKEIGVKYNPDLLIWFESGSGFSRLVETMQRMTDACEASTSEEYQKKYPNNCWVEAERTLRKEYKSETSALILKSLDEFYAMKEKRLIFGFEEHSLPEEDQETLRSWKLRYPEETFMFTIPNIYEHGHYLYDGHPDVSGHKTIAMSIFDYLTAHVTRDCN